MAPLHSRSRLLAISALSMLSSFTSASIGFDCSNIVSQKVQWNLKELGGARMVEWVREIEPSQHNFTFTLDICKPLVKHKGVNPHDECPGNSRVCGVEYVKDLYDNSSVPTISQIVPIAGNYIAKTGKDLDSEVYRLKDSGSHADSQKEGIRVELSGGRQPLEKNGKPQKAIIEFLCDPNTDGKDTEMDQRPEDPETSEGSTRRLSRRDEEGDNGGKKKSLNFLSYKDEQIKGEDWGVLWLEWNTKYACENAMDAPASESKHWGFFTWLIIVVFLATAAYLIFGSWLNYQHHGARGWDALPHGDTLRDLPYIMQDFGRKVASTVQGGGSRGGYSAV